MGEGEWVESWGPGTYPGAESQMRTSARRNVKLR